MRDTGKTYRSIAKAYASGATILCPNQAAADRIKSIATHMGVEISIQVVQTASVYVKTKNLHVQS